MNQIKTAEEILDETCDSLMAWSPKRKKAALKAIHTYHAQFDDEWVSVETALPDEGCKCLLLIEFNGFEEIVIGIFINGKFNYKNTTHWQFLPQSPTS